MEQSEDVGASSKENHEYFLLHIVRYYHKNIQTKIGWIWDREITLLLI